MAGCGEKFSFLVRAIGDRTKSSPKGFPGLWCNYIDVDAWLGQANLVHRQVEAAWKRLKPIKASKSTTNDAVQGYFANFAALKPSSYLQFFGAKGCDSAVTSTISNIEEGACLLEIVYDEIESAGGERPPEPIGSDKEGTDADWSVLEIAAASGGAAVVVILVILAFSMRKK